MRPSSPAAAAEDRAPGRAAAVVSDADDVDPTKLIPLEAARASLMHWWREPIAGFVAVFVGVWDVWHYGRDAGLTTSIDELLILGGIVLIAGSRRLFSGAPGVTPPQEKPPE